MRHFGRDQHHVHRVECYTCEWVSCLSAVLLVVCLLLFLAKVVFTRNQLQTRDGVCSTLHTAAEFVGLFVMFIKWFVCVLQL